MRQFTADYLDETRRGMWEDRRALDPLELGDADRVLDVGCGTGELTRVLAEESPGEVIGVDADADLLAVAADHAPVVAGDATRLPFPDGSFDLVVCQALLINLPDPAATVREFARVSRDRVAAVEPDNGAVTVDSSVAAESRLEGRARRAYIDGVPTDVSLGGTGTRRVFDEADLDSVETRRYDHERTVAPPYSESALSAAKRKASGEGLTDDRTTMLNGDLSAEEFDDLRAAWRAMGRDVIEQMQDEDYRRTEVVPFFVTVGRV